MKIFLSSTYKDLIEIRQRIRNALYKQNDSFLGMEVFSSSPEKSINVIRSELASSDLVVLIIGAKYGSIEKKSHLSYTEFEYNLAKKLRKKIFPFIIQTKSKRKSKKISMHEIEKLEAFKKRVAADLSPDYVNRIALPESVIATINKYKIKEGEVRPFQRYDVFFGSLMSQNAVFTHNYRIVGRESILSALEEFLDGNAKIAVLPGIGGSGKSRILLELARARDKKSPQLFFLHSQFHISTDDFKQLPGEKFCLIIDDAHHLNNLELLIPTCIPNDSKNKILLTTRPSGLPYLESALRTIDEDRKIVFDTLPMLDKGTSALDLAKEALGKKLHHLAEDLVRASDQNPLIITVGGKLISNKIIPPQMLANVKEFQTSALNGLISDLPPTFDNGIPSQKFLSVLSAIGPIRPTKDRSIEVLSIDFKVNQSDIQYALDELENKYGLLIRKGYSIRISPDVLADNLLFIASIRNNRPTSFIKEIIHEYGNQFMENILSNASELEWRCKASEMNIEVIDWFWRKLWVDIEKMPRSGLINLLRLLKKPAIYMPEKTVKVIEWITNNKEAPPETDQYMRLLTISYESIIHEIPPLLESVAYHPSMTKKAIELLWELARDDQRNPNPVSEHPIRILKNLLSYQVGKYYKTQDDVLEALIQIERNDIRNRRQHRYSVSEILAQVLERNVEISKNEGFSFTLGSFPLKFSNEVINLRNKSLDYLKEIASSSITRYSTDAIRCLENLLSKPYGLYGQKLKPDEENQYLKESEYVVEILNEIVCTANNPIASYLIKKIVSKKALVWEKLRKKIDTAVKVKEGPNHILYDALLPSDFQADEALSIEASNRFKNYSEFIKRLAHQLIKKYKLSDILSLIKNAASQLSEAGMFPDVGYLLGAIAELNEINAKQFLRMAKNSNDSRIKNKIYSIIAVIRRKDNNYAKKIIKDIITSNDKDLIIGISSGYSYSAMWSEKNAEKSDIDNIIKLLSFSNEQISQGASSAIIRIPEKLQAKIKESLTKFNFGKNGELIDKILMQFGVGRKLKIAEFSDKELKIWINKIGAIESIDRWHIKEFIKVAAARIPIETNEMLLKRIDYAAKKTRTKKEKYEPLPYSAQRMTLSGLSQSKNYGQILCQIRKKILNKDWVYKFWVPKLFCTASNNLGDDISIEVVREWINSKNENKIISAAILISGCSHEIIFHKHDLIAEFLRKSSRISARCQQKVSSKLFGIAVSGSFWSNPGEPPPRFVQDSKTCKEISEIYNNESEVSDFYNKMARHFEEEIQESIAEDEELIE